MGLVLKCGACGADNPVEQVDPANPLYCDSCFSPLRPPQEKPPAAPAAAAPAPAPVAPPESPKDSSLDSLFASASSEPVLKHPPPKIAPPPAPPAPVAAAPAVQSPAPPPPPAAPEPKPPASEPAEVTAAAAKPQNLFGPPGPDGKPSCVLLGQLAQDAMGPVFKAYNRVKEQPFAVRFMAGQAGEKESALLDERMQMLVRLSHPYILQVQGTGRRQSRLYIATDLVDAEPLSKTKIRDVSFLGAIFKEAAEAVGYAHAAGIYHGDLNPENLLLRQTDDHVIVKDFQLANLLEMLAKQSASKESVELHNPAFLPPEQAKQSSRAPSAAGDVYGLGATFYTALAGRPPFEGATPAKIFARIQMEEPIALEKLRPDVPEALAAVVRHAMAKEPALRYPTAKEMAEAIMRAMKGASLAAEAQKFEPEPIATKPATRRAAPPVPEPAPEPEPEVVVPKPPTKRAVPEPAPTRKKGGWAIPAAAALLLAAGGGFYAYRILRTPIAAPAPPPPSVGTAPAPVVAPPTEEPGQMELDLQPPPSEVKVDGKKIDPGEKRLFLKRGRHRLEIRFGDVHQVDREVDILPGETEQLKLRIHREVAAKHEERGQWMDAERLYREALALARSDERGGIQEEIARVIRKRLEEESVLRIESVPAGAALLVDGAPSGVAPAALAKLKSGPHTIELRLAGYHPEKRRVDYEPGQTPTIRVELRPQTGKVRIAGLRPKDRVKLESRSVEAGESGIVELDGVKVGVFEVVVERMGHHDARAMGRVEADKTAEVTGLVFSNIPGALVVESTPAGAEVLLDGRAAGKTPLQVSDLLAGAKKLRLLHPERSDWDGEVQVKAGEKVEVKVLLPEMAKLAVAAHPEGTRLTGALTGTTRVESSVKAGEHRVTVSHPDAGSVERVFRLAAGENVADSVDLWQLRGDELEKAQKLEEAARAFSKARVETKDKALPRLAGVFTARAEDSLQAKEWTKARLAAELSLKTWPGQARPKEILGVIAYEESIQQAEESAARGEWVQAKSAADRALVARPGDARAQELSKTAAYKEAMARGVTLQKDARWGDARRAFGQALAARPGDGEATQAIERLKALTWSESRFLPGSAFAAAFSPDGKTLAVGRFDKTIDLWTVESGKLGRALTGHAGPVSCVAFSADGKLLASGAADGKVKLWDVSKGAATATLSGHGAPIGAIAFSPDGARLASAGDDKTVRVWEVATGKELLAYSGHAGAVSSVAFSPDGLQLASTGADKSIKIWDAERGEERRALAGHAAAVSQVVFSPDGKRLASAGGDKTVKLWDLENGRELRTLTGSGSHVSQVAFTPDGKLLASVGGDKFVRLWDAETGLELRALPGHTKEIWSVAVAPDGGRMATTGSDGVRLWALER